MTLPNLKVVVVNQETSEKTSTDSTSQIPKPLKKLTDAEQKIWKALTKALHDEGLIHLTDVLLIHTIVTTFVRWSAAEDFVQELIDKHGGFIIKTPNGYPVPHPMYYEARNLKKDLLKWLPEACLTIPAFIKAKAMLKQPHQPGLFDDGLDKFVGAKPRLVSE